MRRKSITEKRREARERAARNAERKKAQGLVRFVAWVTPAEKQALKTLMEKIASQRSQRG